MPKEGLGMECLLIDEFQSHFEPGTVELPDAGGLTEKQKQEWLQAYLNEAELIPIAEEQYERALQTYSRLYESGLKDANAAPISCVLSSGLCREWFVLRHLVYREEIIRDTVTERQTKYRYDFEKNRQMLETLEQDSSNPYRQMMAAWARRQLPVKIPSHKWEVTENTLRRTRGLMRFLGIKSRISGIGEPYRDFYTVCRTTDVFHAEIPYAT